MRYTYRLEQCPGSPEEIVRLLLREAGYKGSASMLDPGYRSRNLSQMLRRVNPIRIGNVYAWILRVGSRVRMLLYLGGCLKITIGKIRVYDHLSGMKLRLSKASILLDGRKIAETRWMGTQYSFRFLADADAELVVSGDCTVYVQVRDERLEGFVEKILGVLAAKK